MDLMQGITEGGHLVENFWTNFAHICFLFFLLGHLLLFLGLLYPPLAIWGNLIQKTRIHVFLLYSFMITTSIILWGCSNGAAQRAHDEAVRAYEASLTPEQKAQREAEQLQAQYDEWIAWQKQEEEKQQEEEKKKKQEEEQKAQAEREAREKEEQERRSYQTVYAEDMLAAYHSNPIAARERYEGKKCRILRAVIESIDPDGLIEVTFSNDPMETYKYGGTDFRCHTKWNNGKDPDGRSISSLHKGDMITIYGKINTVGKITRKVLHEKGVLEDTYMIYTIGDGYDINVTRIE